MDDAINAATTPPVPIDADQRLTASKARVKAGQVAAHAVGAADHPPAGGDMSPQLHRTGR
jgi:hypothetical protein